MLLAGPGSYAGEVTSSVTSFLVITVEHLSIQSHIPTHTCSYSGKNYVDLVVVLAVIAVLHAPVNLQELFPSV